MRSRIKTLVVLLATVLLAACEESRPRPAGGGRASSRPDATADGDGSMQSGLDGGRSDGGSSDGGRGDGSAPMRGDGGATSCPAPLPETTDPVNASEYIDALDPQEVAALCAWSTARQGGPGTRQCSGSLTINVPECTECIARYEMSSPHCLASQVLACLRSIQGDPCRTLQTPECMAFVRCASGG